MRVLRLTNHSVTFALFVFAGAACQSAADEPKFRFVDEFEGKLTLDFEPVRYDEEFVSLTKNPGKLTITTQRGTLGYDETRFVPARNLHLIPNPVKDGGDFVMTTCVESFHPTLTYQQAGLLAYDDDDNYLKYDMEFGGDHVCFKFMHETNQIRTLETDDEVPESERIWIRLTKRGDVYERSYSADGKEFVSVGEQSWGTGAPAWLGLIAVNGGAREDGIDAVFDFLEVRSLTKEERNDARFLERKKLKGAWSVASCEFNGDALEHSPVSEFVFDGARVTFTEQAQAVTVDFALDLSQDPKGIVMSSISRQTKRPANGIYSLDGDALVICLSLQPGAPAPTELETNDGDSRLLLKLKRVVKEKPAVEKEAVEKEAVEKEAVEKEAVEKEAVEKEAVEKK